MEIERAGVSDYKEREQDADCHCFEGTVKPNEVLAGPEMADWVGRIFECVVCRLHGKITSADNVERVTDPAEIFYIVQCPNCHHFTKVEDPTE